MNRALAILIREGRPADASAIALVHVETWRSGYREILPEKLLAELSIEKRARYWESVLSDSGSEQVQVAEDPTGRLVGFASGGPERTGDGEFLGEIYAIYVLEPFS